MSKYYSKLCSTIIGEIFGEPFEDVAEVLLRKGPTSKKALATLVKYRDCQIDVILTTLIQYTIVDYVFGYRSTECLYFINCDNTIEMLRYPKYYAHASQQTVPVSGEVLQELVQAGHVSISNLIYICGHRVQKSNPDVSEKILKGQLELFQNTILRLALEKYIIIIPVEVDNEDDSNSNAQPSHLHTVPDVNLDIILAKLLGKQESKLEDLPDSNTLWRINLPQFHAELRNILVYEALERKFKPMIDTRLIKIIIDLGFEKHPWEYEGLPVSLPELKDNIEKVLDSAVTSKFISEHLQIFEDDPKRLVTKLSNSQGGHFSFNMKIAVTELMWSTVYKTISEKHGFHALRIFRLVKENGFVEQDIINEMGMIPGKDAKHLTYKLVEDNFLNVKEVRKTYATTAPPGKICHVFHVDLDQVVRSLQEFCYKAILNLKQKNKIEMDKVKRLTTKEERITRILMNMSNKNCAEEQLNEIRELLTPPERALLMRSKLQSTKLCTGALQVDETLFVTELYMQYQPKLSK